MHSGSPSLLHFASQHLKLNWISVARPRGNRKFNLLASLIYSHRTRILEIITQFHRIYPSPNKKPAGAGFLLGAQDFLNTMHNSVIAEKRIARPQYRFLPRAGTNLPVVSPALRLMPLNAAIFQRVPRAWYRPYPVFWRY